MTQRKPDKAWQGRFQDVTDTDVERFTESLSIDVRLAPQDVRATKVHAAMLAKVGLIAESESVAIATTLDQVLVDIRTRGIQLSAEFEDVHMLIESELTHRLGETGMKVHTGRSRNDQVVTALRLWTMEAIDATRATIKGLMMALVELSEREGQTVVPAYTHMQRAQPVLAAHAFLAHVERLARDDGRLADARTRCDVLPLGAAAVAGSSLPLDRRYVADELGFAAVAQNSMDATSDRDFVAETLFALSLTATHLSALAEEWILWMTTEFGFLSLPDRLCTGSSIMPQKKNPDILELIRGRTGRVTGALIAVLTMLKGLPLAYNRDLQEDKAPLFDAFDTVDACLKMMTKAVAGAKLDKARISAGLDRGYLTATTLMESLIRSGMPMRRAHAVVGEQVKAAELGGTGPAGFPHANDAVAAFQTEGSTAPHAVRHQLDQWRKRLSSGETHQ